MRFSSILLLAQFVLAMQVERLMALFAEAGRRLTPTPEAATWAQFDAKTPPVLGVRWGDAVEIEALAAGGLRALRPAGLAAEKAQPALREVEERREAPHILTGLVWIEGAEPGDVLEVKILSVDLVVPYA